MAGCTVGVADGDLAAADVHDPPRCVSQLKNIADLAFDGEVFVERADESAFAFGDDPIVGRFGNCAAGSNGRDPALRRALQLMVNSIAVEIGACPIAWGHAFAQAGEDCIELVSLQVAIGPRPTAELEELILLPIVAGDGGDDLLRQDVERGDGHHDLVELAAADRADQREGLQQLVAR